MSGEEAWTVIDALGREYDRLLAEWMDTSSWHPILRHRRWMQAEEAWSEYRSKVREVRTLMYKGQS